MVVCTPADEKEVRHAKRGLLLVAFFVLYCLAACAATPALRYYFQYMTATLV